MTSFTLKDLELVATKVASANMASPGMAPHATPLTSHDAAQPIPTTEIEHLKQIIKALGARVQEEIESKRELSANFQKELEESARQEEAAQKAAVQKATVQIEDAAKLSLHIATQKFEQEKIHLQNRLQRLEQEIKAEKERQSEQARDLQDATRQDATRQELEHKLTALTQKRDELEVALKQAQYQCHVLQNSSQNEASRSGTCELPKRELPKEQPREPLRESQGLLKLLVEKKQVDEENSLLHFEKIALGKRISQLQEAVQTTTKNLQSTSSSLDERTQEAQQLKQTLESTREELFRHETLLEAEKSLSQGRLEHIKELEVQLNHERASANERAIKIQGLEAALFEQHTHAEKTEAQLTQSEQQRIEQGQLLQSTQQQLASTELSLHEIETAFSNKVEEMTHLYQMIEGQQSQQNTLKESLELKESEVQQLKNQLEETKLLFTDASHERAELLTRLDGSQEQVRTQAAELQQARLSLNSLQMMKRLIAQLHELVGKEEQSTSTSSDTNRIPSSTSFFGAGERRGDLF